MAPKILFVFFTFLFLITLYFFHDSVYLGRVLKNYFFFAGIGAAFCLSAGFLLDGNKLFVHSSRVVFFYLLLTWDIDSSPVGSPNCPLRASYERTSLELHKVLFDAGHNCINLSSALLCYGNITSENNKNFDRNKYPTQSCLALCMNLVPTNISSYSAQLFSVLFYE